MLFCGLFRFYSNLHLYSGSLFPSAMIIFSFIISIHILFLGVTLLLGFSTYSSDSSSAIKKACNSFSVLLVALKAEIDNTIAVLPTGLLWFGFRHRAMPGTSF